MVILDKLFEMSEEQKLRIAEELVRSVEAKPSSTLASHLKRASQFASCAENSSTATEFAKEVKSEYGAKYPSLKDLSKDEWKALYDRAQMYI